MRRAVPHPPDESEGLTGVGTTGAGTDPVVDEHDRPGAQPRPGGGEHVRRRVPAPVVRVRRPAHQLESILLRHRGRPRRAFAPRCSPQARHHPDGVQSRQRALGISAPPGGAASGVADVLIAVQPDGVSVRDHPSDRVRPRDGPRRDREERGSRPASGQHVEQAPGPAAVRPVVEGERERVHSIPVPRDHGITHRAGAASSRWTHLLRRDALARAPTSDSFRWPGAAPRHRCRGQHQLSYPFLDNRFKAV
jgi:hypothetical protein